RLVALVSVDDGLHVLFAGGLSELGLVEVVVSPGGTKSVRKARRRSRRQPRRPTRHADDPVSARAALPGSGRLSIAGRPLRGKARREPRPEPSRHGLVARARRPGDARRAAGARRLRHTARPDVERHGSRRTPQLEPADYRTLTLLRRLRWTSGGLRLQRRTRLGAGRRATIRLSLDDREGGVDVDAEQRP